MPPNTAGQRSATCRTSSRGNINPMANIVTTINHDSTGLLAVNGSPHCANGSSRGHWWASADNAKLSVSAASLDGRTEGTPLTVPLGSITDSVMADTTEQLKSLGLDTDYVATNKLLCTDPNDERLCLAELKQSGHFGQLGDFISLDYMTVTVNVQGTLDYQWTGSDGVTATVRARAGDAHSANPWASARRPMRGALRGGRRPADEEGLAFTWW